jgi:hypothetical protein
MDIGNRSPDLASFLLRIPVLGAFGKDQEIKMKKGFPKSFAVEIDPVIIERLVKLESVGEKIFVLPLGIRVLITHA